MSITESVQRAAEQIAAAYKEAFDKGSDFKGEQILDNLAEAIRSIVNSGATIINYPNAADGPWNYTTNIVDLTLTATVTITNYKLA